MKKPMAEAPYSRILNGRMTETLHLHAWHDQIAVCCSDARRAEIVARKPYGEHRLRLALFDINLSDAARAAYAVRRAKYAPAYAVLRAKYASKWDALRAKYASAYAVLRAKYASKYAVLRAKYASAYAVLNARHFAVWHAQYCASNCPWDGETIFTHRDANGEWCFTDEGVAVPHAERLL